MRRVLIIPLLLTILLSSCTDDDSVSPQATITFNTYGGFEIKSITKNIGELVERPSDSTKDDHMFNDWYFDDRYTKLVSWPITLNEDITIHARWLFNGPTHDISVTGGTGTNTYNRGDQVTIIADDEVNFLYWSTENPGVRFADTATVIFEASSDLILIAHTRNMVFGGGFSFASEPIPEWQLGEVYPFVHNVNSSPHSLPMVNNQPITVALMRLGGRDPNYAYLACNGINELVPMWHVYVHQRLLGSSRMDYTTITADLYLYPTLPLIYFFVFRDDEDGNLTAEVTEVLDIRELEQLSNDETEYIFCESAYELNNGFIYLMEFGALFQRI
ncbi:MAG: InlB B-repeat-containing protein [Erysipelotrichaceae bacterium]|jgi:hypothetical protein|nr:InlB B-repeat-containing protein [Erysipelotrichaceae bacterium]